MTENRDGSEDKEWHTLRHYANKKEALEADKVYANARYKIRSKCLSTEVGYICPISKEQELLDAIEEARQMVDEFNKSARFCSVSMRVLLTRVESDNPDGVELLRDTLNQNVQTMKEALADFDVKKARNLLVSTQSAVDILQDPASKKALMKVREEAREMATQIASVLRDYDNEVENALVSKDGQEILYRIGASWNI